MPTSRGLESLIDGAQIPIIESNKDMIMTHANAAAYVVFGYSLESKELLGQKVNILMMPKDSRLHDGYIENYNRTGIKKILSTTGRLVTGKKKNGAALTLRLTTTATPTGYAAVFVDITEQLVIECAHAAEQ